MSDKLYSAQTHVFDNPYSNSVFIEPPTGKTLYIDGISSNVQAQGIDQSVQFNSLGDLAGDSSFLYDTINTTLKVPRVTTGNGTVAAPSHSFTSRPGSGMYSVSANVLGFSVGGTQLFNMGTAENTSNVQLRLYDGTEGNPGLAINDSNTGIWTDPGSGGINFSKNSKSVVKMNSITGGTTRQCVEMFSESDRPSLGLHSSDPSSANHLYVEIYDDEVKAADIGLRSGVLVTNSVSDMILSRASVDKLTVAAAAITSTVPIVTPVGSAAAPSYSFASDSNTGLYNTADLIGFSTGGVSRMTIANGTITPSISISEIDGTAANPSYVFASAPKTGIYRTAGDAVGISSNGVSKVTVASASIDSTVPYRAAGGAVGSPSYAFTGSTNSGIWMAAANEIDIALNGINYVAMHPDSSGTDSQIFEIYSGNTRYNLGLHDTSGANHTYVSFYTVGSATVPVGSISWNGAVIVYSTSDYRLKENVKDVDCGLDLVMALKPKTFKWSNTKSDCVGFLAHEVQETLGDFDGVMDIVTGTKDELTTDGESLYQTMDQSKLIPYLVSAIQELKKEIEELKLRIPI
jgi:hypothetical protein